jgi:diaminopimelate epimerase
MLTEERTIPFSKYNGCGNDFILIDNRESLFPEQNREFIRHLCHRGQGVGANGVILLQNSLHADLSMRIFNSDGTEAEMCGNGVRCLVKFAEELGIKKQRYSIETMHSRHVATVLNDKIAVTMAPSTDFQWHIPITINATIYNIHHLNTGVPHLVWFYESADDSDEWELLKKVDLAFLGPRLRNHPLFKPQGANVNVAFIAFNGEIYNRTFERGVESETLSCGTGCTAVALAAAKIKGISSPITVHSHGGTLEVSFSWKGGALTDVELIGTASYEFSGCL